MDLEPKSRMPIMRRGQVQNRVSELVIDACQAPKRSYKLVFYVPLVLYSESRVPFGDVTTMSRRRTRGIITIIV